MSRGRRTRSRGLSAASLTRARERAPWTAGRRDRQGARRRADSRSHHRPPVRGSALYVALRPRAARGDRRHARRAEQVRGALRPLLGESLVGLDQGELRRRLEALPAVRSARLDRDFPHTLRITVVPSARWRWFKAARRHGWSSAEGRVIREIDPDKARGRPVVRLIRSSLAPEPARGRGRPSVARRASPPAGAVSGARRVRSGRRGAVTLILADGMELRLGNGGSDALKLDVAARVLRSLSADDAAGLAYLDVSVPERAVGGTSLDSQLEG